MDSKVIVPNAMATDDWPKVYLCQVKYKQMIDPRALEPSEMPANGPKGIKCQVKCSQMDPNSLV